jgi:hypothetical protein
VFGKTFPRVKRLVRDPNAGRELESYREHAEKKRKEEEAGEEKQVTRSKTNSK